MELNITTNEVFASEARDARRWSESQKFPDGVRGELRLARELAPPVLVQEMEHPGRDRLCRRFETTEHEVRDERAYLFVRQVVVHVVCDESRGDVIVRRAALCAQVPIEVCGELYGRQLRACSALRAHEEERVDEIQCPECDSIGVVERNTHHPARGSGRKRKRER